MTKIWVLTREENEYDQHGEYFVHVWTHEPSFKELAKYSVTHLERVNGENTWYHLREVDVN